MPSALYQSGSNYCCRALLTLLCLQESGLTLDKAEQQRHVEALNILQDCLSEACCDRPDMLRGHSVSLCHSESATRDGLEVRPTGRHCAASAVTCLYYGLEPLAGLLMSLLHPVSVLVCLHLVHHAAQASSIPVL